MGCMARRSAQTHPDGSTDRLGSRQVKARPHVATRPSSAIRSASASTNARQVHLHGVGLASAVQYRLYRQIDNRVFTDGVLHQFEVPADAAVRPIPGGW